ncbi:MAG: hypothetical protein ACI8UO_000289 [Verrucomicrobiales bacterium]|jgi:hypothetical protein
MAGWGGCIDQIITATEGPFLNAACLIALIWSAVGSRGETPLSITGKRSTTIDAAGGSSAGAARESGVSLEAPHRTPKSLSRLFGTIVGLGLKVCGIR